MLDLKLASSFKQVSDAHGMPMDEICIMLVNVDRNCQWINRLRFKYK